MSLGSSYERNDSKLGIGIGFLVDRVLSLFSRPNAGEMGKVGAPRYFPIPKLFNSNWLWHVSDTCKSGLNHEMKSPSKVPNPGGEIDEKGEICSKLFSVKQNELTHLKVKVLRRHFQSPTTNLHILAPGHTKVLFETRCW